ncbi:MAG: hypothetical protein AAGF71_00380 [Pseudomonadota bacterium]
MLILTRDTLWNPSALDISNVPRRFLGRRMLWPKPGIGWANTGRWIFEMQLLRYLVALLPFVIAMVIWPDLALPIAQAPLLMIIAIGIVEMQLLHIPKAKRDAVTTEAEAARVLDAIRFRGTKLLRRVAAARELTSGELSLVIEQSELANIRPVTLVSVQRSSPKFEVLGLSREERDAFDTELFDDEVSERDLALANQREHEFLRSITFDTRGVSAHARLAARLSKPRTTAPEPAE